MEPLTKIEVGVAATRYGSPGKINSLLQLRGVLAFEEHVNRLDTAIKKQVKADAQDLRSKGVVAILRGTSEYPKLLDLVPNAPPVLFCCGQLSLLNSPSIGICGSRKASDTGLHTAAICGRLAIEQDLVSVSGYARGVDMATHVSTLDSGGATVIVLPEGISHFKVKREIAEVWDPARVLVVSQFSPSQTWSTGTAMTRNSVIIGLSLALVVIEAGEKGGTLAAGRRALELGRRVIALEFPDMPKGNTALLKNGAVAVSNPVELNSFLHELRYVADELSSGYIYRKDQGVLISGS